MSLSLAVPQTRLGRLPCLPRRHAPFGGHSLPLPFDSCQRLALSILYVMYAER